jgi:hypothetical protein
MSKELNVIVKVDYVGEQIFRKGHCSLLMESEYKGRRVASATPIYEPEAQFENPLWVKAVIERDVIEHQAYFFSQAWC